MGDRRVAVVGGSVAGLSAALLLARDGHSVTLIERDRLTVGAAIDSPDGARRGIAHFLQPHAFLPRGRAELQRQLPDVYEALIEAGASDVDLRAKLPGEGCPDDAELQFIAVRRPLIEWGLRRAVVGEPRIQVVDGVSATGVTTTRGRISAVEIGDTSIDVDLLIDACGRRTSTAGWIGDTCETKQTDCGVIYYSRYYRVRDNRELPDGPWFFGPRGDLGYMAYSTFPGDNRTFAGLLAVPPGVPEWRVLKHAAAFESAVSTIPALRSWINPDMVEPLTDVMPMAGLRNALRDFDPAETSGLIPIGDALAHTDPVMAHGLSFALIHAAEVTAALRDYTDIGDAGTAFATAVMPALRERFELASQLDAQRLRMWLGHPVDFAHRDGDYALFTVVAGAAAAALDADAARVFIRRIGLLDSTRVLDEDEPMQRRLEAAFQQMAQVPRPPSGPSRADMAALVAEAVSSPA